LGDVDSRPLIKLADNQVNGGLVIGQPSGDWRSLDPNRQPVLLLIGGEPVARTAGGHPAGDPFRLIRFLMAKAASHCGGLKAGQIITTGALTGGHRLPPAARLPGTRAEARFPGLGTVVLEVTA
jgi:2-keto-4-pentenoate hydratase